MDAHEARRCCSILCLDVPLGTLFGVDLHAWTTGPKFRGVKVIPPGTHIFYYNAANEKYGKELGPRSSFFAHLKEGDILVKRWDPLTESFFSDRVMDQDEVKRYQLGVYNFDFDQQLGAYPLDNYMSWQSLSSFVSKKVLDRLEPIDKQISSEDRNAAVAEAAGKTSTADTDMSKRKVFTQSSFFTKIPQRKTGPNLSPADVTKQNFDKSAILEDLIANSYEGDEALLFGEVQYAFVLFFIGENYDGFEQWKALVHLLCSCESALSTRAEFFERFCLVLQSQLAQAPEDFFVDPLSQNNFLVSDLKSLFELTRDTKLLPGLRTAARELQSLVEKRFKTSLAVDELGEGDDAPVVVELPDDN